MRCVPALLALCVLSSAGALGRAETPNALTATEKEEGWQLLFDGKSLLGFRGVQKSDFLKAGWKVEDGALTLPKSIDLMGKVTGGDLATVASFADFEFAFEWKTAVSAASGVMYGAKASFASKPTGYIFQIIDDVHNPDGLKGGPIRQSGALYGILPPGPNKKINEAGWNTGRIVVQGSHVEHWVNEEKVLEYTFGSPALMQAIRMSKLNLGFGFGAKPSGQIVLMDKGDEVSFRSLKIRLPQGPGGAGAPVQSAAAGAATPPLRKPGATPFKSRIPIPGEPD